MDCAEVHLKETHMRVHYLLNSLIFGEKLVVNSGSPFVNDKKWIEAMRSTAAHSTVSIDDVNSSDIFIRRTLTLESQKSGQNYS